MKSTEAKELLKKYQDGQCTNAEKALVETWYLQHKIKNPKILSEDEYNSDIIKIWDALGSTGRSRRIILWTRISVAALILFTLSASLYFFLPKHRDTSYARLPAITNDIAPGGNKAILILADGSKVSLTDAHNGEIAKQAGLKIVKDADGHLNYIVTKAESRKNEMVYNTIETPKGGQYQVTLPDGTDVWLDAASSLKYPTVFAANERRVELNGQAYFEVVKDKSKPFKVISSRQQIEVLGTHFNVNAYNEEPEAFTTLLEGSVKISRKDDNKGNVLVPGEQADLNNNRFTIKEVDVQEAIAWKNGIFMFSGEDVKSALNKIAKWYDVDVECDERLEGIKIGGNISRSKNLSEVLKVLQLTGDVQFKIEGRRIIAMP